MSWISRSKRTVLSLALFILIAFATGEFLTRIMEKVVYKFFAYKAKVSPHGFIQWGLYKKYYKSVPEKPYRYEHRPNISLIFKKGYYTMRVKTNSEGLREEKDYNYLGKSIIFLGDSIVEGASVDNDQTFESIFERLTGITALNFGVGSSNTRLEYYFLKAKYRTSYNTCHIVLGFCLNDWDQLDRCFDENYGNWVPCKIDWYQRKFFRREDNESSRTKVKNVLKKSHFVLFLWRSYRKIVGGKYKPYSSLMVSKDQICETEEWILKIKKFADNIGACFTVVIFPRVEQFFYEYKPGERQQDVLIKILERHHIDYIDLYDFLKREYKKSPEIFWDYVHPYVKGHRLIGEYLASHLKICKCKAGK